jgi:hypothetical protein
MAGLLCAASHSDRELTVAFPFLAPARLDGDGAVPVGLKLGAIGRGCLTSTLQAAVAATIALPESPRIRVGAATVPLFQSKGKSVFDQL